MADALEAARRCVNLVASDVDRRDEGSMISDVRLNFIFFCINIKSRNVTKRNKYN